METAAAAAASPRSTGPGRSPRQGGERSRSQLPLPTGSSPDEEQFYTRVIWHNPCPPGSRDRCRVTALLQGARGCRVPCWLGLALLVIKDTRMGFERLVLFSGYPSGSASPGGMEDGGDPRAHSQPSWLPLLAQAPALPQLLQWGEKASRAFASNTSKTRGEYKPLPWLVGKRLAKWFAGCTLPAAVSRHEIPPCFAASIAQGMLEDQVSHKTLAETVKRLGCPQLQEDMASQLTGRLAWTVGTSVGMERGDKAVRGVPGTIPTPAPSPASSPPRPRPDQMPGSRHPHGCTHEVLRLHKQ